MSDIETLTIYFLCTICAINLYVSYCILSSNYYGVMQEIIQFLLIWLLPILGSLLCYSLAKPSFSRRSGFNDDVSEYPGVGLHGLDH